MPRLLAQLRRPLLSPPDDDVVARDVRLLSVILVETQTTTCGSIARNVCYKRSRLVREERSMLTGGLLWLIGIPIPVIILVWFFFLRGR